MNKLLSKTITFEERRNLLINSEAWNCDINKNNNHLSPNELTEDNIDKEIERIAISWGISIQKRYETLSWIPLAMNSAMCEVYIP